MRWPACRKLQRTATRREKIRRSKARQAQGPARMPNPKREIPAAICAAGTKARRRSPDTPPTTRRNSGSGRDGSQAAPNRRPATCLLVFKRARRNDDGNRAQHEQQCVGSNFGGKIDDPIRPGAHQQEPGKLSPAAPQAAHAKAPIAIKTTSEKLRAQSSSGDSHRHTCMTSDRAADDPHPSATRR